MCAIKGAFSIVSLGNRFGNEKGHHTGITWMKDKSTGDPDFGEERGVLVESHHGCYATHNKHVCGIQFTRLKL